MKFALFTIACLALVICATSKDLNVGKRQPGDVLVASRKLVRAPHPLFPSIAISGYNANGNITHVSGVNAPGSNATVSVIKGGPGNSSVVVLALSPRGHGLNVQLDIYAILKNVTNDFDVDDDLF
ncbi:probable salivary secreted peptide [Chelonus insularis]|uniref:probable salivary secreted peptide n=1 Tax=Chelonus insularis TaxID=460826 RepID=UPI0015894986|nr:probable salivary secreted peptide [Chelonus insularis]